MFKGVVVLFIVTAAAVFGGESIEVTQKNRMHRDLDFIQRQLESGYAPAEWKKQNLKWDLNRQISLAKQKTNKINGLDIKQFQLITRELFQSTQDYHVEVHFSSTESASLPFDLSYIGDKYLFSYIEAFDETPFPFAVGDELISMDGIPMAKVVADFRKSEIGHNNEETDRAIALQHLTIRKGALGHRIPQGAVELIVKKGDSGELIPYTLLWDYKPENVSNPFKDDGEKNPKKSSKRNRKNRTGFGKRKLPVRFVIPQYEVMQAASHDDGRPKDRLGSKRSLLANLGMRLELDPQEDPEESLDEESFFDTRQFELPSGKHAGYIRIPTYDVDFPDEAVEEFSQHIAAFQSETDILVIDQTNNPGGDLFYMYALASMLTDRPLVVPKHRRLLTQEEVISSLDRIASLEDIQTDAEAIDVIGEDISGYPVNLALVKGLLREDRFIIDEWNQGRLFTNLYAMRGIEKIEPHPSVRYTKPILILVNERDFSGGDFFPAIFQDNDRATIMGTRTAGAGGAVQKTRFPNLNGISSISYTFTIAYRADGSCIENRGVTPDIPFKLTPEDIQGTVDEPNSKIIEVLEEML